MDCTWFHDCWCCTAVELAEMIALVGMVVMKNDNN